QWASPLRLARLGYAHGDLSACTLLVHGSRLVMIDVPQIVDLITNPRGVEFLTRDSANVARWFTARGLTAVTPAPAHVVGRGRAMDARRLPSTAAKLLNPYMRTPAVGARIS